MKRINPYFVENMIGTYIEKAGFLNKFIKYWGTTTVGGHEVLRLRNYWFRPRKVLRATNPLPEYAGLSEYNRPDYEKWAKVAGVWEDTKNQSGKGIDDVWWYLNPIKADSTSIQDDLVANNLRKAMWDSEDPIPEGLVLKGKIVLGPEFVSAKAPLHRHSVSKYIHPLVLDNSTSDQAAIIAEVQSKFANLWDTHMVTGREAKRTDSSGLIEKLPVKDPWSGLLLRYILGSADVPYTITRVSRSIVIVPIVYISYIKDEYGDSYWGNVTYNAPVSSYVVEVEIPYYNVSTSTDIVESIMADIGSVPDKQVRITDIQGSNALLTKNTVIGPYSPPEVPEDADGFITYPVYQNPLDALDSTIWVAVPYTSQWRPPDYYIRVDFLRDNSIPIDERIEYLTGTLDYEVVEESRSFWDFVLIVVIFVVAIYTGGAAAAGYSGVVAGAVAVTTFALVVSVAMAVAGAAGMSQLAMSLGKFMEAINPIVQIAGVVALVGSIYQAAQKAAEAAAKESLKEAGKEVTKEAVEQIVKETIVGAGIDQVKQQFIAPFQNLLNSSLTDLSMNQLIKFTSLAFDLYQKNQLGGIMKDIKRYQRENEKYAEEQAKTTNVGLDFIEMGSRPLLADWSIYAARYDRPYEWWATRYHTGCIQAGTIKATWLADESADPTELEFNVTRVNSTTPKPFGVSLDMFSKDADIVDEKTTK